MIKREKTMNLVSTFIINLCGSDIHLLTIVPLVIQLVEVDVVFQ